MTGGGGGRPLRFLAGVALGWIALRVAMLWPATEEARSASTRARSQAAPLRPPGMPARLFRVAPVPAKAASWAPPPAADFRRTALLPVAGRVPVVTVLGLRFGGQGPTQVAEAMPMTSPGTRPRQLAATARGDARRWIGSAWLLARGGGMGGDGGEAGLGGGSPLGASQAGVRVGYAVDAARRLMPYARLSAALDMPAREAALGIDWRPTALPVHLIAEQRLPLDGGRGGPTLGAIGGIGPMGLPKGFTVEGYGEAGVILRDGGVGFADGSVRVGRRVARAGPAQVALGAGAWGAVQPGASRLDIGPAVTIDLPMRTRFVRLTLDWRQRVAGDALPRSGPALTLGADF